MFATTATIRDTTSMVHATRLECRQGLRRYQQKFPSNSLLMQQFDTNVDEETNEKESPWDGALVEGTTTIRSGPDYNKVNATLILPDGSDLAIKERLQDGGSRPHQQPTHLYLHIFVGTYETVDEAVHALRCLEMMLMNLGRGHDDAVLTSDYSKYRQAWEKGARTKEQLQLGLRPCWLCHDNFSTKKCSACKFQWYCCVEHQKDDWNRHKPICKQSRGQRKKASKLIKTAKSSMKERQIKGMEMNTILDVEVLSPPATKEEKQEASQLYGFLFDLHGNELDVMSKVQLFTVIDSKPRLWPIMLACHPDFLSKISALIIQSDGAVNEEKKRWKPIQSPNVGQWFCTSLLRGLTKGPTHSSTTFSGCNAARTKQFMVDTDQGFESVLVCLHGGLQKLYHPKTGNLRGYYDQCARDILRFLTGSILCNKAVGGSIVTAHVGKPKVVLLLKAMMDMCGDEKNAKYDSGSAVEGLVNNLIGLVHVWTETLNVHVGFFDELKIGRGQRYVMYRIMAYRMSQIMVEKGRHVNPRENQMLSQGYNAEMIKLSQELNAEKKLLKKKKGRKGKRR